MDSNRLCLIKNRKSFGIQIVVSILIMYYLIYNVLHTNSWINSRAVVSHWDNDCSPIKMSIVRHLKHAIHILYGESKFVTILLLLPVFIPRYVGSAEHVFFFHSPFFSPMSSFTQSDHLFFSLPPPLPLYSSTFKLVTIMNTKSIFQSNKIRTSNRSNHRSFTNPAKYLQLV